MASEKRLSGRAVRVAAALRERAEKLEHAERFNRQVPDLDPAFIAEFNEVLRRLGLRMVYTPKVEDPNSAAAAALREEAASLDEIASTIRGTAPFRLDGSELRGCAVTLLVIAAAGGVLLWFNFGPRWVGISLLGLVIVMTGIVIAMHRDVD
jgi:hypothetical protein